MTDGENRTIPFGMVPVPLPIEVPAPPDLSSLPSHIVHSGTIETLLGQNEDLMARLKVNIRRNSILEQKLMEQDRISGELTRANDALLGQLQILQEKDRLLRDKVAAIDRNDDDIRETIELLQTKLQHAESKKQELMKYQRRIRSWVRPLVKNLKSMVLEFKAKATRLEATLTTRDALIGDLRSRMNETIVHCQGLERNHNKNQATLVAKYEEQVEILDIQLEKARNELQRFRERAERVDELSRWNVELQNRVVQLERQRQEDGNSTSAELKQAQQLRSEAKRLAMEILEKQKIITEFEKEREDFRRLQEQFESLQLVWSDSQKKSESLRAQNDALKKLNQELSGLIKDSGVSAASGLGSSSSAGAVAAPLAGKTVASDPRTKRIDALLAEIESGIGRRRKSDLGLEDMIEDRKTIDIFKE